MDSIGHMWYSALNQKHGKAIKVQQTMQTNSKQLLLIGKHWPLESKVIALLGLRLLKCEN